MTAAPTPREVIANTLFPEMFGDADTSATRTHLFGSPQIMRMATEVYADRIEAALSAAGYEIKRKEITP